MDGKVEQLRDELRKAKLPELSERVKEQNLLGEELKSRISLAEEKLQMLDKAFVGLQESIALSQMEARLSDLERSLAELNERTDLKGHL